MIISRAPLRISLGGGGTDLPSYYEKREGFLIAGAINKHVYVGANHQFYDNYSLKYSKIEIKKNIHDIEHPLFREAIRLLKIKPGIELTSLADVPAGTGLGSSGSFLVALLNTLHYHKYGEVHLKRTLAEEACQIEIDILKEHEGKQDPYASAMGGIRAYKFHKPGGVSIIPLENEDLVRHNLEEKLLLFFSGKKREGTASDILKKHDNKMKKNKEETLKYMDEIKDIGKASFEFLQEGNFEAFGCLMHKHWCIKKKYSPESTSKEINSIYDFALDRGALGGKVVGAGGGGFLMFYHPGPSTARWDFIKDMEEVGYKQMEFKFDIEGVTKI